MLGGHVVRCPLPPGGSGPFETTDASGGVAVVARGETFMSLEILRLPPETTRGGHLHAAHVERVYLISGTASLIAWLPNDPDGEIEIALEPRTVYTVRPGTAHACRTGSASTLAIWGGPTDPFTDRIRHHPRIR